MKRLAHMLLLVLSLSLPMQVLAGYAPCLFEHGGQDPLLEQVDHHAAGGQHDCCPDQGSQQDDGCQCHSPVHANAAPLAIGFSPVLIPSTVPGFETPRWVSIAWAPVTPPDIA